MFITYAHKSEPLGQRYRQMKIDPVPGWAVDIQDEVRTKEIRVILHTGNGDVVTAYPSSQAKEASEHFMQYINTGKNATMTNVG